MKKSINHKLHFSQPPREVWEYLTKPELMELWLMKNNFTPVIGHPFQFRTNPNTQLDFDGIVHCTVLEIVPFKKLSYSWKCGPGQGKISIDSVVVWTLIPKESGTELQLDHDNFKEMGNLMLFNAMDGGWLKNIHKIFSLINNSEKNTGS